MTTPLGYQPNRGKLILSVGADWVCTLQEQRTTWPEGTEVWCEVDGQTWDAVVTPATATAAFVVQSDSTDSVDDGAEFRIYKRYPTSPTTEYLWFLGRVERQDNPR